MNLPSTAALDEISVDAILARGRGGGMVPFRTVCDCPSGRRRPPIRLNRTFAAAIVQQFPEQQQIATYRCGDCGGTIPLVVGHLDLSAPATS